MQTSQPSSLSVLNYATWEIEKGQVTSTLWSNLSLADINNSTANLCWPSPDRCWFLLIFHRKLSYFDDYLGKIETRGHEIGTDPGPRTLLSGFSQNIVSTSALWWSQFLTAFLQSFLSAIAWTISLTKRIKLCLNFFLKFDFWSSKEAFWRMSPPLVKRFL